LSKKVYTFLEIVQSFLTMEKQQLEQLIISGGLTPKEASIYLFLLEAGPQKALPIFKALKMKKGNTYALLDKLVEKGFVIKKGPLFSPQSPLAVFYKLEEKVQALNGTLGTFKATLPQLNSLYKLSIGKPTIRYFEGEEGIKEVFEDIYARKKDVVYGCVDLDKADEVFPGYIVSKLIPKRVRNKVQAISFLPDSPSAREVAKKDKLQLRETALVDKKKYPLPAEIDVYEDKVAMLTFARGEFIGLIIENKDIAESLRSVFKLASLARAEGPRHEQARHKT
jgi:sugar-specific transcriptional regulator TrmB